MDTIISVKCTIQNDIIIIGDQRYKLQNDSETTGLFFANITMVYYNTYKLISVLRIN